MWAAGGIHRGDTDPEGRVRRPRATGSATATTQPPGPEPAGQPRHRLVVVFEDSTSHDPGYSAEIIRMAEEVPGSPPSHGRHSPSAERPPLATKRSIMVEARFDADASTVEACRTLHEQNRLSKATRSDGSIER